MRRLGLLATQLQQAAHLSPDRLPQGVLATSNVLLSAALGNQQVRTVILLLAAAWLAAVLLLMVLLPAAAALHQSVHLAVVISNVLVDSL
jgi:hypothetical protein